MRTPAHNLQAGDDLRMFDGTWITARRVTREANHIRIWPMSGPSFTVLAAARWEIRKAPMPTATVERIDPDTVRAQARARFTLG